MRAKSTMLSSTVVPLAVATGFAGVMVVAAGSVSAPAPARANPCAVKRACNPAAAKNPCKPGRNNPCAARNPCNPCAGSTAKASSRCIVPRLAKAAAANPCAAKKPCGPCAPKASNPCAAKGPCNPCSPCGAAATVELTDVEANAAYDCILPDMKAAYAKAGLPEAEKYASWERYNRVPYQSATHGNRFVNNYANDVGADYGNFEKAGPMPAGTYLVKDSFTVSPDGKVGVGPLFVMQKMAAGFDSMSHDWKYGMVTPEGALFGETNGRNSDGMKFCYECHALVPPEQDSMYFLPEEFRRR